MVTSRLLKVGLILGITAILSVPAVAQTPLPGQQATPTTQKTAMPHITVDHPNRWVDIDATVVLRQGGWLELLACTPDSRTHESILAIHALPSHVHLALLTLGLEPGAPMKWRLEGDDYVSTPAHGPKVAVTIVVPQDGAPPREADANTWFVNKQTGQSPPDNIWLFTGSSFDQEKNPPRYRADVEGSIISLVHFGDEVLARPTDTTNQSDQGMLQPNTELIPQVGTKVKVRLRPAGDQNTPSDQTLKKE